MAVVLEGSRKREDYCFQHDIQFESAVAYKQHKKWCDVFLVTKNLCTFSDSNGLMCALEFKHVASLVLHVYQDHHWYLCVHCRKRFESIGELEMHSHITRNVHESKEI